MRCLINREYIPLFFIVIYIFLNSNLNAQHIKLTWSPNPENDIKYYVIYRASTNTQETEIANVPATDTTFLDYDIVIDNTYYYRIAAVDSSDNVSEFSDQVEVKTNVFTLADPSTIGEPERFALSQNYPNPFNPETTIQYTIANEGKVNLSIFDILGREIRRLVDERKTVGYYTVKWDGKDNYGNDVSTGIYLCQIRTEGFSMTKKIMLTK